MLVAQKVTWKRFIPYLDISIDLGFFRIRTDILQKRYEQEVTEYVGLYVKFFKWHTGFRLYNTWTRIYAK